MVSVKGEKWKYVPSFVLKGRYFPPGFTEGKLLQHDLVRGGQLKHKYDEGTRPLCHLTTYMYSHRITVNRNRSFVSDQSSVVHCMLETAELEADFSE